MHRPARALSSLALALTLAACQTPGGTVPGGTKPSVRPTSPVGAGLRGANLVGMDGASLVGMDGASIKVDASMLIGADGGSLIGADGGSLIGADGGSLIGADGGSLIGADGASLIGADGASIAGAVRAPAGLVAAGAGNAVSDMGGMYRVAAAPYGLAAVAEKPLAGVTVYLRTASGKFLVDRKAGKLITAVTNAKGEYSFAGWKPVRGLQVFVPSARVASEIQGLAGVRTKDQGAGTPVAIDTASTLMTAWINDRVLAAQANRADSLDRLPASLGAEAYGRVAAAARADLLPAGGKLAAKAFADALERLRGEDAALGAKLEEVRRVMTLAGTDSTVAAGATAIALQQPVDVVQAPDGSLFVADAFSGVVRRIGADGRAVPVVGQGSPNEGEKGSLFATDLAVGPDGKLYLNSRYAAEIFRCNPDGSGLESFAGGGGTPVGPGVRAKGAKFEPARAIAFDAEGGLLIAEGDSDQRRAESRLLRVAPDGTIALLDAPWQGLAPLTNAWREINAMAAAPDGALWIMEFQEGTLWVREPGAAWRPVATGLPTSHVADLLPQADGSVLVSMGRRFGQGEHVIDRFTRAGVRTRFAGTGEMGANAGNVAASAAKFADPAGLAAGKDGAVLVADKLAGMVRAIGADGTVRTVAGRTSADVATAVTEPLNVPGGIAIDAQGRVIVTEYAGHTIRRLDGESMVRIAGGEPGVAADGSRADRLFAPAGVAFQGDAMLVVEQGSQRVRRIAADGTITTLAGGGPTIVEGVELLTPPDRRQIRLDEPLAVAVSPAGLVHFTDREHLWRLAADGRLELVAGIRELEAEDDPGARHGKPAREVAMGRLGGIAFDQAGNLYASEVNTSQIIKIDPAGVFTVHAGAGPAATFSALFGGAVGSEGEVAAAEAIFVVPSGLAFDAAGNLYVTEMGTRGVQSIAATFFDGDSSAVPLVDGRIRKITPDGRVTTIAGLGGPSGTALRNPVGVVVDPAGRVIFVDNGTNQLKRL